MEELLEEACHFREVGGHGNRRGNLLGYLSGEAGARQDPYSGGQIRNFFLNYLAHSFKGLGFDSFGSRDHGSKSLGNHVSGYSEGLPKAMRGDK